MALIKLWRRWETVNCLSIIFLHWFGTCSGGDMDWRIQVEIGIGRWWFRFFSSLYLRLDEECAHFYIIDSTRICFTTCLQKIGGEFWRYKLKSVWWWVKIFIPQSNGRSFMSLWIMYVKFFSVLRISKNVVVC